MSQFSYLSRPLTIQTQKDIHYLFDASNTSLPIYFALKGRHGYKIFQTDKLIADIKIILERFLQRFNTIVIPESRSSFIKIVTQNHHNVVELKKRPKEEICQLALATPTWRKLDKASAKKDWDLMGETFTMNLIKKNKRNDYVPHLFEPLTVTGSVLLIDDFIMSGNTISAMQHAIGTDGEVLGIFYQK